jgi:hypothetical protein
MEGKLNVDDHLQDHQYQSTDMAKNTNTTVTVQPIPVTLIEMTKSNIEITDNKVIKTQLQYHIHNCIRISLLK